MRFPVFVLCAALLVPTTTHAARPLPTDVESIELWFLADISIATDGRISGHAWRNFNDMPNAVLAALEQRISTWQFQPGNVDDVPAEIGTSLLIHAFAIESGDGAFALEIANAIVGPSLNEGRRPELDFPDTWRSAYGSGAQVFDVAVQPEREAAIRFGEYIADTRRPDFKAGFRERAADLVSQWGVRHESIAGRPVTAHFRHAIYHCRSPRWCRAETAHWGLQNMPPGQPVPARSVTRLLSDVATVVAPDSRDISTAELVSVPAG